MWCSDSRAGTRSARWSCIVRTTLCRRPITKTSLFATPPHTTALCESHLYLICFYSPKQNETARCADDASSRAASRDKTNVYRVLDASSSLDPQNASNRHQQYTATTLQILRRTHHISSSVLQLVISFTQLQNTRVDSSQFSVCDHQKIYKYGPQTVPNRLRIRHA